MGPVITSRIRVRYGETDQMGVVYYANYLVWFEVARTEYCRVLSFPYTEWEKQGVFLPAVESHARYRHSLRYDEVALVKTSVQEVKPHTITFSYQVIREEDDRLAAEGWTRHAFCGSDGGLVRRPEPFYSLLLEKIEQSVEEVVTREQ